MPLLCAIDIGITGCTWSTLRNWSTIAITTEETIASRMDCAVAKAESSGLCWAIIWGEVLPNRCKADVSYCGIDRGGDVYPELTRLVDSCFPAMSRQAFAAIILRTTNDRRNNTSRRRVILWRRKGAMGSIDSG
ncbi:hypothetical protein Nham_0950 [Nitrobacter hamburgensis X14]|uniref:Uncharacterized protein n=1 Tax=Nitrobacter hamburgensis (strain DSM 10229 / NCIMB 13809 / X14) TaxID=323097 RepID=Q1QPP2_NITHX|nr:hypothetical protein Nham_0950 [Nitrobacter hamburgensis X14]